MLLAPGDAQPERRRIVVVQLLGMEEREVLAVADQPGEELRGSRTVR